jgi:hypothetical protein
MTHVPDIEKLEADTWKAAEDRRANVCSNPSNCLYGMRFFLAAGDGLRPVLMTAPATIFGKLPVTAGDLGPAHG